MGRVRDRESIAVDGTWDIETEAWTRFLCGALYLPGFGTQTFRWQEEDDFVDALLAQEEMTLWAHFGGNFDMLWLAKHIARRGISDFQYSLAGSAVAAMKIGNVTFRDSFRLIPMPLEKASQLGNVRKSEAGVPFERFKRGMRESEYKKVIDYMVIDCIALYSALDAVSTFAERHDLDLRPTIGASAWATVERSGVEKADWKGSHASDLALYQRARQAYYGGRTQVFQPVSAAGYHYDINSAYPAALASLELPMGERTEVHGKQASRAYANGQLGLFRASVHVPRDIFVPPLPVRTRFRSAYPVGRFGGWWSGLELKGAEALGATIRRVDAGLVWSARGMVLEPFCRHVWALRDAAGPKTAWGAWLKWYANSLTGKLAMRPESESIVGAQEVSPCPASFDCRGVCDRKRRCCRHHCSGHCGATRPLGPAELGLFARKKIHLARCAHVEWAAHLTAHARLEVARFAEGGDDAVYCDTDSLFCERRRNGDRIGPALGQWKLEDRYRDMLALAPKTYRYTDADTQKQVAASKGIANPLENFGLLEAGRPVTVEKGVMTFRSAVQTGDLFTRKKLTRQLRGDGIHFGDRVLRKDGRTYPQTVKQIDEEMWELSNA
jgi:hypothetical protein